MKHLSPLFWTAAVLVLVGGLNWGLVGILGFNAVDFILTVDSPASRIVYALVGLSSLYLIFSPAVKRS